MGYVSSSASDCPAPGAIIVKYGPKYVFTQREVTKEVYMSAVMRALIADGTPYNHGSSIWHQRLSNGEYVVEQVRTNGELEAAVERIG